MKTKLTTVLLAALFLLTARPAPLATAGQDEAAGEPLIVFLARHAEKAEGGRDPELSPAGAERATELAQVLRSADLEHVHSSNYRRTRDTAAPVAEAHGLEVELYDPRDLGGLAKDLRAAGGRHLVVGHSNTTPQLTELLGGEGGQAIHEPTEYDRLYVVTVAADGTATSALLRFGAFHEADGAESD